MSNQMSGRITSVLSDPRFTLEAERAGLLPPGSANRDPRAIVVTGGAGGGALSAGQETDLLLQARPSLLVRQNRYEVPKSGIWADVLGSHRALIEPRLPSVGRVEVDDGTGYTHRGTAWVIAEKVVATNRHVAQIFARRKDQGIAFLITALGSPYRARIDFREEYKERETFEVGVEEVIFMEDEDPNGLLPDVALLRLSSHEGLPAPIAIRESPPAPGGMVAVIGYPAADPRYGLESQQAAKAIFGAIYNVKRLSPGVVMGEQPAGWYFRHDATTLGGNSGSVVLDMETGYAIGLHYAGEFKTANYAVKGSTLLEYARDHTVSVLVRKPLPPAAETAGEQEEAIAEGVPEDYADRQGYQANFLGDDLPVPLPAVTDAVSPGLLTFLDPVTNEPATELKYTHFSVVMDAVRRQCFYSAVNIDGKQSIAIKGRRPSWRTDARIPKEFQILGECYGKETEGKFSRGHMTRREDPDWGPEAIKANTDTFHATNAVPQIQPFNAGIWNDLEDYALQNARQDDMRICVFTGPIFAEDDPEFFGVKVPVRFWKVIVFVHDKTGKLCATGYTMSQRDFLPGQEFVYGSFQTYQTSLAEIEGLTGLSFGELKNLDPFKVVQEAPPMPLRAPERIRFA